MTDSDNTQGSDALVSIDEGISSTLSEFNAFGSLISGIEQELTLARGEIMRKRGELIEEIQGIHDDAIIELGDKRDFSAKIIAGVTRASKTAIERARDRAVNEINGQTDEIDPGRYDPVQQSWGPSPS